MAAPSLGSRLSLVVRATLPASRTSPATAAAWMHRLQAARAASTTSAPTARIGLCRQAAAGTASSCAPNGALRPWGQASGAASYFTVPEPSWNREHIEELATGRRGRNRGWAKLGHRLNPYESRAVNLAKTNGYLAMQAHCGVSACNKYLHFCFEDKRPYLAINQHGDRVVVDLYPVEGLRGDKSSSRMDEVEDLLSEVLDEHWIKTFQIVNEATEEQTSERRRAASAEDRDGSNEHKAHDADIAQRFHILTRKRQDAIVLVRDMHKALLAMDPTRKSAKDRAEARAQKQWEVHQAWEKGMRRKLRALIADEKAFKRLPKGALDGFMEWDEKKLPHLKWYPAKWINKPC